MAGQAASSGEMMLTVMLKHRQSMNLAEINQKLEERDSGASSRPRGSRWCPGT
jgi:hypothetical protein